METSGLDMHPNLGHVHVIWNLIQGTKVSMLEKTHFSLHSVTLGIHLSSANYSCNKITKSSIQISRQN